AFLWDSEPALRDMKDENGELLFERARSKLGPLEPHEIYGFEPAIVLGGKILLENLAKVNTNVHLTILRQFAEPELPLSGIDIEKLLDS
ncbi:T6SS immunity protein Tdi1 domain-containing protein, partial [Herbaspirillum sp. B65]|uniref:T6SS immunity protein Tdi1 domain-containing protein n=1 Tax=Herbaspirillum sp. B65 TaxID=137708 RepID=UPI0005C7FAD2